MENTTDKVVIDAINETLSANHGRSWDNRPMYRIVWSDDQLELRKGTFSDWYGHIFLREVTAVREGPKYPFVQARWIFEKLIFLPSQAQVTLELVTAHNGSYEALYVFQDKDRNPLPVTWWAVEALLQALLAGPEKRTASEMKDDDDAIKKADAAYFEEVLDDEGRSPLFAFENSVVLNDWSSYAGNAKV